jgi:hypothetical protein
MKTLFMTFIFIFCSFNLIFSQVKDSSSNGFKLKQLITRQQEKVDTVMTDTKKYTFAPRIALLFPPAKKYNTTTGHLQITANFKNISGKRNVILRKNFYVFDATPIEFITKNDVKLTWDLELSEGINEFEIVARNNIRSETEKLSVVYTKPNTPKITLVSPSEALQTTLVSVFTVVAEIRNIFDVDDVILKRGKRDKILPNKKEKIADGFRMVWDVDLDPGQNEMEIIAKNSSLNSSSKFIITYKEPKLPKFRIDIWAIVIGISKYKNSSGSFQNLKYAAEDAKYFYDYLVDTYGNYITKERVVLLTNEQATRSNIIREIKEKSKRAGENDLIFVYFAGHGMAQTTNRVFFFSYDTDPDLVEATAVPNSDITALLDLSPANKKILIADACHSGLLNSQETRGLSKINELILELAQKQGYYIFTSAGGSEEAQEGEKWGSGHGVFTYYFVQGLKGKADTDHDKVVTIGEIYDFVRKKVRDDTDGKQYPQLMGNNLESDFPMSLVK